MPSEFFTSLEVNPQIYAYITPGVTYHEGFIKIGYTERDAETRIKEQTRTPGLEYKILLIESAVRDDGTVFTDKDIHKILRKNGFKQSEHGAEWFKCSLEDVQAAIIAVRNKKSKIGNRTRDFKMRPEQERAVAITAEYFTRIKQEAPGHTPKFLWNAKMRFGKTFAAYQLCKRMDFKKILILTFKPVVEAAWSEDLSSHIDFEGWEFVSNKSANFKIDSQNLIFPVVVFGSFQDLLGTDKSGGIKAKNKFIHETEWDLVIFDEYHFGAWRDNAKNLFKKFDEESDFDSDPEVYKSKEAEEAYNEKFLPIKSTHYLYLSGTPFRALNSGEFIEEQIFNWTYSDEQQEKLNWKGENNPYKSLPRMVMMTYQIPDSIRQIAEQGEFNEFDLNVFFSVKNPKGTKIEDSRFLYEDYVRRWLNLIHDSEITLGQRRPPMPFSDSRLLKILNHTLWFLPDVASCYAMYNLLNEDKFFHDYKIIVCAGTKAGVGLDALPPVLEAIDNPFETKTITLSCGKLTTGVTVSAWSGVFMLRNLKTPETYFQTAFRVQSPWTLRDDSNNELVIKQECYIFDFAIERALKQIADYSCQLNVDEDTPEKKVAEFINFLPVLAYDGAVMREINAQDILDIVMSGTSATLLARRWQSALLVNVDNATLARILDNPEALAALEKIEGLRALNKEIPTIINESEKIKKARQGNPSPKVEKKLSEEEKALRKKRTEIREKLIKFCTRIPIFMYLTDEREENLKDIITQIDSRLFTRVTGLEIKDFDLLNSLGVFNSPLMNDAIYNFKRYEDASLEYTGRNTHQYEKIIGGFDTKITSEEFYEQYEPLAKTENNENGYKKNNIIDRLKKLLFKT